MAMLRAFPDVAESKMVFGIVALLDDDDVTTALRALLLAENTYPKNAGGRPKLSNAEDFFSFPILVQCEDRFRALRVDHIGRWRDNSVLEGNTGESGIDIANTSATESP